MNIDKFMFAFAGALILLSLALGHWWHPVWLLLTAFIGANMLQAAFTGFCPMAKILKKVGFRVGHAFE